MANHFYGEVHEEHYEKELKDFTPVDWATSIVYLLIIFAAVVFGFLNRWGMMIIMIGATVSMLHVFMPFVHLWFVSSVVLFYVLFPWIVKASNGKLRQWSFACFVFFFACKLFVYFCLGKDTMAYRLIASSQFDCIFCGVRCN